jgi:DNA-binding sugar fermentation-stimulating protein
VEPDVRTPLQSITTKSEGQPISKRDIEIRDSRIDYNIHNLNNRGAMARTQIVVHVKSITMSIHNVGMI